MILHCNGNPNITTTQESSHVGITTEDNAPNFLEYHGYCSLWIIFTRPNSQPNIIWKPFSGCMKLYRKRPELWPNDQIFNHDNAPAHKVLSSSSWPKNLLLKWKHPSYSADVAPNKLQTASQY